MSSCLTCDHLRSCGRSADGTKKLVYCTEDPKKHLYVTELCWKGLALELRSACELHERRCAQCGEILVEVSASRSHFCPTCRKLKRKVSMGMLPVEALLL
jgi:hypothetical protein